MQLQLQPTNCPPFFPVISTRRRVLPRKKKSDFIRLLWWVGNCCTSFHISSLFYPRRTSCGRLLIDPRPQCVVVRAALHDSAHKLRLFLWSCFRATRIDCTKLYYWLINKIFIKISLLTHITLSTGLFFHLTSYSFNFNFLFLYSTVFELISKCILPMN